MIDLSKRPRLESYFSDEVLQQERTKMSVLGCSYMGHTATVPEKGNFRVANWEGDARFVLNGGTEGEFAGKWALSNVCRHRQATILKGMGRLSERVVCPIHNWVYGLDGELTSAPHFPANPCLNLGREKLDEWNGFLFSGGADMSKILSDMPLTAEMFSSGYELSHIEVRECNYNWKTFIEIYHENYHVVPFHPGLGRFVSLKDLRWEKGDGWLVQRVGMSKSLDVPGTQVYEKWHKEVREFRLDTKQPMLQGAIWMTVYPGLMVEWYPHAMVVSSVYPVSPQKTLNVVEFLYPPELLSLGKEFIEAERNAYIETADEDDEIGERMDAGRLALFRSGREEHGPYQEPLEDGMRHFHEFYHSLMS